MTKVLRYLFVAVLITFAMTVQTARAEGAALTGAFSVTFAIIPGTATACTGGAQVEAHGIGQTAQGPMFVTVKKCFYPASGTYVGTFALCGSSSACRPDSPDAISGTYVAAADVPANVAEFPGAVFAPFHGTLTIDRDNGHNGWARGTIDFTAIAARLAPLPGVPTPGTAYYSFQPAKGDNN
jgi:hypothetical protein